MAAPTFLVGQRVRARADTYAGREGTVRLASYRLVAVLLDGDKAPLIFADDEVEPP